MSTDNEKFEALEKEWVGQHVKIIGFDHPHFGSTGTVKSFDHTNAGIGIRIELDDTMMGECYVFKGRELKKI